MDEFSITIGQLADFLGVPLDGTSGCQYLREEDAGITVIIYRDDSGWHASHPLTDDWAPKDDAQAASMAMWA